MPKPPSDKWKRKRVKVRLDWREYFLRFCQVHGEPITIGSRLLFPDGWQYASTQYQGPEFAPPDDPDQLRELQLTYWRNRRTILAREYQRIKDVIDNLKTSQNSRSVPLQQREVIEGHNEETGSKERKTRIGNVDFQSLATIERRVRKDINQCALYIAELMRHAEPPTEANPSQTPIITIRQRTA